MGAIATETIAPLGMRTGRAPAKRVINVQKRIPTPIEAMDGVTNSLAKLNWMSARNPQNRSGIRENTKLVISSATTLKSTSPVI